MAYLLRHVRYTSGRPDAVRLEPALTEPGGLLGCCAHCGGNERLLTVYAAVGLDGAAHYWRVFNAAVATRRRLKRPSCRVFCCVLNSRHQPKLTDGPRCLARAEGVSH